MGNRLQPYRSAMLLVVAVIVCGVLAWTLRANPACLSVPTEIVVRGNEAGGTQNLVFEAKNIGGAAITLLGSKSSCGCTIPSKPSKSRLLPGESCQIPLSVNLPLQGEDYVQLEIQTDSPLTPLVIVPIRLIAGETKTPILLTMNRSLTLRGTKPDEREKTILIKTLEREDSAPWITSVKVDRMEIAAKILGTTDTPLSSQPGVVMREYTLQASRLDVADRQQALVCRISFQTAPQQPPIDFACDVLLAHAEN